MQISALPEPEAHPLWPFIELALEGAATDVAAFDPDLDVLWTAHDGATFWGFATMRMRADEPTAELLCVAGSRFREWIGPMEAEMCDWARQCGASRFVSRGRKGWARFARAFGWAPIGMDEGKTLFTKDLS